ncbi:dihydrolipoamide acetyltransferase family protein [Flavobacterium algicola]|uniref:dihydrolipoamide acetyltransferase family protein n=1 Tax=Flavobacterium algicola TaxID=556529 RepID=UPI001EFD65C5|nr:dihydrolipoamide acetyltransferase family protein [Flavobacterium algicola]MCG9793330.1 2-oxo acid dehydrogenase subunit E2 [Flavobacterium algicola]
MARFELKLPKMGESVAEATITNWLKSVGDKINADETVVEVATDKVDNEVPSEVSGILVEQLFDKDDLVQVGQTIAIIETSEGDDTDVEEEQIDPAIIAEVEKAVEVAKESVVPPVDFAGSDKFYSPLVKNIATTEGVSIEELETIKGTGKDERVTKDDILNYVQNRAGKSAPVAAARETAAPVKKAPVSATKEVSKAAPVSVSGEDEVVEMDRMRKLISGYMVASIQTSVHVQSFIEVDVTNIVKWRDKHKTEFEKREGEKLTYTPIFMEAVAKALKDYPGMNVSVDGDYVIKKKNINLGMAAALPNGNLIVPVIKNADQLNLVGMAKAVNDLGNRAKQGKLKPDDTKGGTYTVTNIGSFGSVFGTPIINQPEVGILALGAIRKVPAVIETPDGDFIGIRQKMFLTHSYDHRVVDGALGGMFVKRVAEYLEKFDISRNF